MDALKFCSDPIAQFKIWFKEAQSCGLREPSAFSLATMDGEGKLHSRILLCKEVTDTGFIFYTNYQSKKGQELSKCSTAAANFFWDPIYRQIKISGNVTRISAGLSDQYWNARPRESQLAQWVSRQSETVPDREEMENQLKSAVEKFAGKPVPRPAHWGGYHLEISEIEFWVGQPGRFHDRFHYSKVQNEWSPRRLFP